MSSSEMPVGPIDRINRMEQACVACENSGVCLGVTKGDREASLNRAMASLRREDVRTKTPLILCGDRPIMRGALHALLDAQPGFHVVIEAAICPHAIRFFEELDVKVAVVDLDLLDSAPDGLRRLHMVLPPEKDEEQDKARMRVLVLTTEPDPAACRLAFEMGVRGMVLKSRTLEDLFGAIARVSRGDSWLEGPALEKLLRQIRPNGQAALTCSEQARIALLTARERQIIEVAAKGATNEDIGKQLFISGATVRHHLCAIFEKLGLATRGELIVYAFRHHLADRRILDQH